MTRQRALQRTDNQHHSTPEWYTPSWLLERVAEFYGGTYFDPCPARHDGPIQRNGLAESWAGQRVYCNPPYGADIKPWIRKAVTEPTRELILLVPAYTDTQWFGPLFTHTICFVSGRLYFMRPGQHDPRRWNMRAPHPSVLIYRGRRHKAFAEAFRDLGPIMRQYRPRRAKQPTLLEAS